MKMFVKMLKTLSCGSKFFQELSTRIRLRWCMVLLFLKKKQTITPQNYPQIDKCRYARYVYLVFVFTMLLHWKWINNAENSYFRRNWQNGREISSPCSQKCPNSSRETQVQTLYPICSTPCITHLLHLCIDFSHAIYLDFAYNQQFSLT